jgi:hypothetical protein
MWYNTLNLITNAPALLETTGGMTTHERMCCMPQYNRACPVCQKEFVSVYLDRCFCCSPECGHIKQARERTVPVAQRFWAKVNKGGPDDCWLWTGALSSDGYGRFNVGGRNLTASRLAYELTYGTLPSNIMACHKCDNPPCCNPNHLFPGSNSENQRDMVAKNRGNKAHGEAQPKAKLTAAVVIEIRKLRDQGYTQDRLSQIFGVGQTTISTIVQRKTWKHIQ